MRFGFLSSHEVSRTSGLVAGVGLIMLTASCAAAQSSEGGVALTCEQAVSVSRGQDRTTSRAQGIGTLGRCPTEFGEVVPQLWRQSDLSADAMGQLKWTSRGIRDRRVFEALVETTNNPGVSTSKRLSALAVLVTYVDPSSGADERNMLTGRFGDPLPSVNHANARDGEQPTGQAEVAQIINLIVSLAESGSPQEMQRAGQYLRAGFIGQYAAMMPLPFGSVIGTWDCQGHLTLENKGTFDIPLALVDSAGTKFHEFLLHAPGTSPWPSRVSPQFTRTGPLTVQFGGRQLLRLTCQ